MQIEIPGSRCAGCNCYTQYYKDKYGEEYVAVDCGYCGRKSRNVRPGDRCREWSERSNVTFVGMVNRKKGR